MPTPPLSEAELRRTLQAYESCGRDPVAACALLGLNRNTFMSRLHRAQAWQSNGGYQAKPMISDKSVESFAAQGDLAEVSKVTHERVKTLDDLIRVCGIDTDEWLIDRWVCGVYEGQAKNEDTQQVTVTPLYQVKAWLKRNKPLIAAKAEIDALFAQAAAKMPTRKITPKSGRADLMTTVEIFDLHLGKLAWGKETGHGDYDLDIACERFRDAVEALIERTSHVATGKILFPVGNDFYHADNKRGQTTNGTQIDMDSRYVKMYQRGRELTCWAIERLLEVAPVEAVIVPGNHDRLSAFTLGDSLWCYFRNTKHVTVDNSPTVRKYRQHGAVMLLYVHGDAGKFKDLPLQMATDQPVMWSQTRFREAHVGHLHGEKADETKGVKVRVSPALCEPDAWHSENQYTGNLLSAESYVWSSTEGPIIKAFYTVPMPLRASA